MKSELKTPYCTMIKLLSLQLSEYAVFQEYFESEFNAVYNFFRGAEYLINYKRFEIGGFHGGERLGPLSSRL
jgi:hypothetical protein